MIQQTLMKIILIIILNQQNILSSQKFEEILSWL